MLWYIQPTYGTNDGLIQNNTEKIPDQAKNLDMSEELKNHHNYANFEQGS